MAHFFRRGEKAFVRWTDAMKGAGRKGRREASCIGGDHRMAFDAAQLNSLERNAFAKGARSKVLKVRLLFCYGCLEREQARIANQGGRIKAGRLSTILEALIDRYLESIKQDVEVRKARGGRAGKAPATLRASGFTMARLREFIRDDSPGLLSGDLRAAHLKRFRERLVRDVSATGEPLAPATVNQHLRQTKTMLNYYFDEGEERPYFQCTPRAAMKALKAVPEERAEAAFYAPDQIRSLFEAALTEPSPRTQITPWLAWFLLSGCRRHEAEGLEWKDVDLDRASVIIRPEKTGHARRLLLNAERVLVSPRLWAMLRAWREASPEARWVLPVGVRSFAGPTFPRRPWDAMCKRAGFEVTPKQLRSNWVSYMAALGRPLSSVALMAGHSARVLEGHYLAHAQPLTSGDSLEEAMGVLDLCAEAIVKHLAASARRKRSRSPKSGR